MPLSQSLIGIVAGGLCGYVCINRCSQQSLAISHYMRRSAGGTTTTFSDTNNTSSSSGSSGSGGSSGERTTTTTDEQQQQHFVVDDFIINNNIIPFLKQSKLLWNICLIKLYDIVVVGNNKNNKHE
eukprot:GHVS01082075.1.p2 GENE.GHVS01082075.1~~GHVS01082075.1.p2  ORF type:complete len:126 (-),score=53.93 GHVS01082075.1:424-801(-)